MKGLFTTGFFVCAIVFAGAQTRGPQTIDQLQASPAGSKIIKLLDFISSGKNLGDKEKRLFTQRMLEENSEKGLMDFIATIRENDGNLVLYKANRLGMFKYELTIKSEKGNWLSMDVSIQESDPYAIDRFGIRKINPEDPPESILYQPGKAEGTAPRKLRINDKAIKDIGDQFEDIAKTGDFSGVIGVFHNWEALFIESYGSSNLQTGIGNEKETKFNIGSLNKLFTSIAVLKLVQEGKLSLTDPMIEHLPEMSDPKARSVTIEHLIKHTSGYGMYWDDPHFLENRTDLLTIPDYMVFLKDAPIGFDPGSSQRYSNTGYVLLGAVIERITENSYQEYIESTFFKPLGMLRSGHKLDFNDPELATGYSRGFGSESSTELSTNTEMLPPVGNSAGGGFSTVSDLMKFVKALYNGELLNPKMTAMATSRFTKDSGKLEGMRIGGGAPGINAIIDYNPEDNLLVVVLANLDPPSAESASRKAKSALYQ